MSAPRDDAGPMPEPTFDPERLNEAFRKLEELTRPPLSMDDFMKGLG